MNVVTTGLLARSELFDDIWIQPAAGDAGGALGAALWFWHMQLQHPRQPTPADAMQGSLLGPEICTTSKSDDHELRELGAVWTTLDDASAASTLARLIAEGFVVAVARGRMEWGPAHSAHDRFSATPDAPTCSHT